MPRPNLLRSLAMALALTLGGPALAARYVVESPAYGARTEAEAHLKRVLVETGDARCRVVRRYVRGEGWRYLVALEGLATEAEALGLRERFDGDGEAGTVWRLDDDGRARVTGADADRVPASAAVPASEDASAAVPPGGATERAGARTASSRTDHSGDLGATGAAPGVDQAPPAPAAVTSPEPATGARPTAPLSAADKRVVRAQERAAEARLLAAAEAHGGASGGRAVLDGVDRVRFVFRRALPRPSGALVASHTFLRDGAASSVDIKVESGDGVDSQILLARSGRAWVTTGEGTVPRDPDRTRDVVHRFSPESLLSIPLGFAEDLAVASAWRGLRLVESGSKGTVLEHPGGGTGGSGPDGLVRATFDKHDHLVVVDWREGGSLTRLTYSRYKTYAPGLVLPQQVEVWVDGRTVERLEISVLELDPVLDGGLFDDPS